MRHLCKLLLAAARRSEPLHRRADEALEREVKRDGRGGARGRDEAVAAASRAADEGRLGEGLAHLPLDEGGDGEHQQAAGLDAGAVAGEGCAERCGWGGGEGGAGEERLEEDCVEGLEA